MKLFLVFPLLLLVGLWVFRESINLKIAKYSQILSDTDIQLPVREVPTPTSLPSTLEKMKEISLGNSHFRYAVAKVTKNQTINLFPNFDSKTKASDLFNTNGCKLLVNGSFYDKSDKPLGLFVSQGEQLHVKTQNTLMDGVILQTKDGKIMIEFEQQDLRTQWALQSGPMLVFNSKMQDLKIIDDQQERRMVAAVNKEGDLFFITVVGKDFITSGPNLSDLPQVITTIGKEENEKFESAINLDGGTASAFINSDLQINEYTWIGSFFCVR